MVDDGCSLSMLMVCAQANCSSERYTWDERCTWTVSASISMGPVGEGVLVVGLGKEEGFVVPW
jgi:hypothetical protein